MAAPCGLPRLRERCVVEGGHDHRAVRRLCLDRDLAEDERRPRRERTGDTSRARGAHGEHAASPIQLDVARVRAHPAARPVDEGLDLGDVERVATRVELDERGADEVGEGIDDAASRVARRLAVASCAPMPSIPVAFVAPVLSDQDDIRIIRVDE